MSIRQLPYLLLTAVFLTACTPDISSNHYDAGELGRAQNVQYGTIVKIRPVQVSARGDNPGAMIGVATGATLGSAVGGSARGNILGAIGGAVVGGLAGDQIGRQMTDQRGLLYVVRLDNGRTVSIVQGIVPRLYVGQSVMLLRGGRAGDRLVAS